MRHSIVLTFYDGSQQSTAQLNSAIEVARWFDAEMSVAAVAYLPEYDSSAPPCSDVAAIRKQATTTALERSREIFSVLAAQKVSGGAFPFLTTRESFERQFACLASYADLVVRSDREGADIKQQNQVAEKVA